MPRSLCVTSAKHNSFICKIGLQTASHCPECYPLVQAKTVSWQCWSSCFYYYSQHLEWSFLVSALLSGFPPQAAKQSPYQVVSKPLTDLTVLRLLCSRLASGSLSHPSPPQPQGLSAICSLQWCSFPGMSSFRFFAQMSPRKVFLDATLYTVKQSSHFLVLASLQL